jgi:hypothetical protein
MRIIALVIASLFFFQAALTNKDIVDLTKGGIAPEIIVAKIKVSPKSFDTSPDALKELKKEGVADSVIIAMLEPTKTEQPSEQPQTANRFVPLEQVKRIYLAEMGKSDDAERFRYLLNDELAAKGFTVVENEEDADATLSGIVSTQLSKGTTHARAAVKLKSPDGRLLWQDEFGVHIVFGFGKRDSIKLRAEDVADGLRDAVKKAGKKK